MSISLAMVRVWDRQSFELVVDLGVELLVDVSMDEDEREHRQDVWRLARTFGFMCSSRLAWISWNFLVQTQLILKLLEMLDVGKAQVVQKHAARRWQNYLSPDKSILRHNKQTRDKQFQSSGGRY